MQPTWLQNLTKSHDAMFHLFIGRLVQHGSRWSTMSYTKYHPTFAPQAIFGNAQKRLRKRQKKDKKKRERKLKDVIDCVRVSNRAPILRAFKSIRHCVIRSAMAKFQQKISGSAQVPAQKTWLASFTLYSIYSRYCSLGGILCCA